MHSWQIFITLAFFTLAEGKLKNSCTEWADYHYIQTSPNCYHNPDVFSNIAEMLERYFGPHNFEKHTVVTDDGYILTMFRIIRHKNKGVVMLQHPITTDGIIWLMQGKESIAYILWTMGYEIWLPNHRGTEHSEGHVSLTVDDFEYWDFSYHKIGIYDYPKFVERIVQVSGPRKINFIGHSMSCASGLILASLQPEFAKKHFHVMVLMGPAVFFKYVKTPIQYLSVLLPLVPFAHFMKWGGIFRPTSLEIVFIKMCFHLHAKRAIDGFVNFLMGFTYQFEPKFINLLVTLLPKGAPMKMWYHFGQLVNNGGMFRPYDYGTRENLKRYNAEEPPSYPLEHIRTPIFLVASEHDAQTSLKDAELIYVRLRNEAKIYGNLTTTEINHLDYHFGKNRFHKIINPIIDLIEKINT